MRLLHKGVSIISNNIGEIIFEQDAVEIEIYFKFDFTHVSQLEKRLRTVLIKCRRFVKAPVAKLVYFGSRLLKCIRTTTTLLSSKFAIS